ncbi:MAG: hypothetical protein PHW27_06975 [Melioribacteraceae bacterium]|nr:hypothetical protein [Melioribacteraceae bacterium]MDD3558303.1 hypothetical protein [Melioribacteraceae bacterium]
MIEIKIPASAAVILLKQRMNQELSMREKAGKISSGIGLNNLSQAELLQIAETSAFDIVFLLPADVWSEENNVADIIYKAIHSLASVFNREEFKLYKRDQAEKLIKPIKNLFAQLDKSKGTPFVN